RDQYWSSKRRIDRRMNHHAPNSMTAMNAYRISTNCQNCPLAIGTYRPTATSISWSRNSASTCSNAPSLRSSTDRGGMGQVQIEAVNLLARHVAAKVLDATDLRQVHDAVGSGDPVRRHGSARIGELQSGSACERVGLTEAYQNRFSRRFHSSPNQGSGWRV